MKHAFRAKIFLAATFLALVVASIVYLVGNPGLKKAQAPVKDVKQVQAEVVIDGFHFAKNDGDKENWDLKARKAEMKKDSKVAELEDLEAVFCAKNGTTLNLKADSGMFDTQSKSVKLSGDEKNGVVITSNSGYRMSTRNLDWNDKEKKLSTDGVVTLRGKNISIEGKGMVARSDLQEVRINNGVKTVFTPSK
jgi:LPS export ABC transporter protein LptC